MGCILLASCNDEEKTQVFVDLRYEVADRYEIPASPTEPISFKVKSNQMWEVFSKHNPEWVDITPNSGNPNEDYDVSLSYKDNTELDDRFDTIVIKSDYWVGKEFVVLQKGTAFLDVEDVLQKMVAKSGEDVELTVRSNQNWSMEIAEKPDWIECLSQPAGSMDGTLKFKIHPNEGERRTAKVVFFDRNGEEVNSVEITQDGVLLVASEQEARVPYGIENHVISVSANIEWIATVDDEYESWLSISNSKDSYDGDAEITLEIYNNNSPFVRVGYVDLMTKGDNPIKRRVAIKQGYLPNATVYEFDSNERNKWSGVNGSFDFNGDMIVTGKGAPRMMNYNIIKNNGLGMYEFNVKSMDAGSQLRIYLLKGDTEIHAFLNAATELTQFDTRPVSPVNSKPASKTSFDSKEPITVGIELSASNTGYLYVKWLLNSKVVCEQEANNEGGFIYPYNETLNILIDSNPGTIVLDSWQYRPLMDWNNVME